MRSLSRPLIGLVIPVAAVLAVSGVLTIGTDGSCLPTTPAGLIAEALPMTSAQDAGLYFAPTGRSANGDFLKTFQKFGLSRIGYPVSEERIENGLRVQYFERVRMEAHPELVSKGYGVLMSRLGVEMTQGAQFARVAPFASTGTTWYFGPTGHSLSEPFLSYWRSNGSAELFGYPISEPLMSNGTKVQWFERARFEYRPELAAKGQAVQLSLLGSAAYQKAVGLESAASPGSHVKTATTPVTPPQDGTQLSDMESYLLEAINDQRARAGLAAVQASGELIDVARARSNDMATRRYFSHTTPDGADFLEMLGDMHVSYKIAGEILARNNCPDGKTVKEAMDKYLGSVPHKAVMLEGRFSLVGLGHAKGGDGLHYFTVIFLQP